MTKRQSNKTKKRLLNVKRQKLTSKQVIEAMQLCVLIAQIKGYPIRLTHAWKLVLIHFADHPIVVYWNQPYIDAGVPCKHGFPPQFLGLWNETNGFHGHIVREYDYNAKVGDRALSVMLYPNPRKGKG